MTTFFSIVFVYIIAAVRVTRKGKVVKRSIWDVLVPTARAYARWSYGAHRRFK